MSVEWEGYQKRNREGEPGSMPSGGLYNLRKCQKRKLRKKVVKLKRKIGDMCQSSRVAGDGRKEGRDDKVREGHLSSHSPSSSTRTTKGGRRRRRRRGHARKRWGRRQKGSLWRGEREGWLNVGSSPTLSPPSWIRIKCRSASVLGQITPPIKVPRRGRVPGSGRKRALEFKMGCQGG